VAQFALVLGVVYLTAMVLVATPIVVIAILLALVRRLLTFGD